ncbi:MAG: hypothetical protein M2R45_05081 [Verrucomicrobia subdivision 3 bacterium]|nr:hypothetical protein [Limisphaerales bacterium]MCS1417158.1 hypothetical protein [Limisphaerales bacterium]
MDQEASSGFDSPAVDEVVFEQLALRLFRLQAVANGCYRRIVEYSLPSVEAVDTWRQIPAVPTAAFKEYEMTALGKGQRLFVFRSSGTTERNRSQHFHSRESVGLYERSLTDWFSAHFFSGEPSFALRGCILTPSPAVVPDSSLVHMFETVRQCQEFSEIEFYGVVSLTEGWELDGDRLVEVLEQSCLAGMPAALLGTAFSYVQLLDVLSASGRVLKLPAESRLLETGGYKGQTREIEKGELYRLLSEVLGIPKDHMVSEYGMSELSSQAYDHRIGDGRSSNHDRCFRLPSWARFRVVSPETGLEVGIGESGLIQVFDLANVWSVMGIQTEDLGRRLEEGVVLLGRAAEAEVRGCSLMPEI